MLAIETQITEQRRENGQLKQQVAQLEATITSLKRDLAGAQARLSDVTGELKTIFLFIGYILIGYLFQMPYP